MKETRRNTFWKFQKTKFKAKWLTQGSSPNLHSISVPISVNQPVYSERDHKHNSYPSWHSLSARSVLLASCSSSQPRCADSFMLCFCAISKTMFSSSSSSILFLSVSRSCTRHAWMNTHIQLTWKIVLTAEMLQPQHTKGRRISNTLCTFYIEIDVQHDMFAVGYHTCHRKHCRRHSTGPA